MNLSVFPKHNKDILYYYKFLSLTFLEIILAFSTFGYIIIEPVSFTFMHIPVLLGALFLGPFEGLFLGFLFGLTSMWKATATALTYADIVFSPFASGEPIQSLFLSVCVRMVFGFVAGILFCLVKNKLKHKKTGVAVVSIFSTLFHSVLIYQTMGTFFPKTGVDWSTSFQQFTKWNSWISYGFTAIIILFCYYVANMEKVTQFKEIVFNLKKDKKEHKIDTTIILFVILTPLFASSLLLHFFDRIELLLRADGIHLESMTKCHFYQIGLQFIFALLALCGLIAIIINFFQLKTFEMEYKANRDLMTGLYNKSFIIDKINKLQYEKKKIGAFIMLDLDNFKLVNDTYGHPFGDKLLIQVADIIANSLSAKDMAARFGGDEFCIFCPENSSVEQICFMINNIFKQIKEIAYPDNSIKKTTCSVGITIPQHIVPFEKIYNEADHALYSSKKHGKNQYTIFQFDMASKIHSE